MLTGHCLSRLQMKPLLWKDIILDFPSSISLQDTYAPIAQLSKSQLHNPWECHINEISKKIASGISVIKHIMYFLPSEILLNSLVQPHLLITV